MIKKFCVYLDRNGIVSDVYWIHLASVIQGISYGLCSIPNNTTCWDIEYFGDVVILQVECTKENINTFSETIAEMFPTIKYTYKEIES